MAYRSSSSASGHSAIPAVSVPSGVDTGDIVILAVGSDSQTASFASGNVPAGFTLLYDTDITVDGHSAGLAWKRLTGADTGS